MSTTIDERVVEMRFDNRNFERNVSQSISTLDKLKQRLNLKGASKGLEDVGNAARKVSFNPLANSVDAVKVKFSAMETVAMTTLSRITNRAIDTGKNLVSAFTIDPVKSGLEEYETQLNAVQTILANTESKGSTIDDVNAALSELNTYADQTIYNFTEMTRNIGTFTAAGVGLKESTQAIKGIANLAAVSGSNSTQASTAMYQLSQALATGKVALQDWNSVVNAGMGGEVFQTALKRTAQVMGTGVDQAIKKYGTFRESLTQGGWLTKEVLTETLAQLSGAYTEADLIAKGYSKEQAKEIYNLSVTATDAATKVKTFSQLLDTLKEAAQSGWTTTWQYILGDFEEAKSLWTGVSNFVGAIIDKTSKARNFVVDMVMNNPLAEFAKKIGAVAETAETTIKKIENFDEVIKKVINGKYGHGKTRWDKLTEEGYNWAKIQNEVNKQLGSSVRHDESKAKSVEKLTTNTNTQVKATQNLSDAQLKSMGLTDDEILLYKDLEEESRKTGKSIQELVTTMTSRRTGRDLLFSETDGIFANLTNAALNAGKAIKQAWEEIFPPKTMYAKADAIYGIIKAINDFSNGVLQFTKNKDEMDKLTDTFKGLFSVVHIASTIIGGGFKIALKVVSEVLKYFNLNILDVTSVVGRAISSFDQWLSKYNLIGKAVNFVMPIIQKFVECITRLFNEFKQSKHFEEVLNIFNNLKQTVTDSLGAINISSFNFTKAINKLDTLNFETLIESFKKLKNNLTFDNLKEQLINIGSYIYNTISGFIDKIYNSLSDSSKKATGGIKTFCDTILGFFESMKERFKDMDIVGSILAILTGFAMFKGAKKALEVIEGLLETLEKFAKPLELLEDISESLCTTLGDYGKKLKSEAFKNIAISIGILAASLFVLSKIDSTKLFEVSEALILASVSIGALYFLMSTVKSTSAAKVSTTVLSIAASILILTAALKKVEEINMEDGKMDDRLSLLARLATGLLIFGGIASIIPGINKSTKTVLAFSVAMRIMINSLIKLDGVEFKDADKTIDILISVVAGLGILSLASKNISLKSALGVIALAVGLNKFIKVINKIASLDTRKLKKSFPLISSMLLGFRGIMMASAKASEHAAKAGAMLLLVSVSMLLMVSAIKKIGKINKSDLDKAKKAVLSIMGIFGVLIMLSEVAGENAAKAGLMLMGASAGLLAVALGMRLLCKLDPSELKNAEKAVGEIMILFAVLIAASYLSKNCKETVLAMAATIGVLTIAMGALSLIKAEKLLPAAGAISMALAAFSMALAATGKMQVDKKTVASIIFMSNIAVGLASLIAILSNMSGVENYLQTGASLSILLLSFSESVKIISDADKIGKKAYKGIAVMTAVTAGLAVIIGGLSAVSTLVGANNLIETSASISILLLSLSGAIKIVGDANAIDSQALAGIATMTAVTAGLAVIIGALSSFTSNFGGGDTMYKSVVSLSGLLIALSGVMLILDKVGTIQGNTLLAIGIMTAVVAGLAVIIGGLSAFTSKFGGGDTMLNSVLSLSTLLIALSVAINILSFAGTISGSAIGSLVVMTAVLAGIAGVLALVNTLHADTSIETAGSLSLLLITLCTSLLILSAVGSFGNAATKGAVELLKVIGIFTAVLAAFGAISTVLGEFANDRIKEDINSGIELLTTLSSGLGEVVGGLIGGIGKGITDSLPSIGDNLSKFGESLAPFLSQMEKIDPNVVGAVKTLCEALLVITGAQIIHNLTGFLIGDNDMETFGKKLKGLGVGLTKFSEVVKGKIDSKAVEEATNAGRMITKLAESIPNSGGLLAKFLGDNDIGIFGKKLPIFGRGIVLFSKMVSGQVDSKSVEEATNAGKMITELADTVPNSGGKLAKFLGDNDIAVFGKKLPIFAKGIVAFSNIVSDNVDKTSVEDATNAGKMLTELADSIPNSGGLLAKFIGDNDITDFGKGLVKLGSGIALFSQTVKNANIDNESVEKAKCVTEIFMELQKSLPKTGGLRQLLGGSKDLGNFGKQLKKFASSIVDFADTLTTGKVNTAMLMNAANGINNLIDAVRDIPSISTKNIDGVVSSIENLATKAITSYENSFKNAKSDVQKVIIEMLDNSKNVITNYANNFKTYGNNHATSYIDAIRSYKETVKLTLVSFIKNGIDGLNEHTENFKIAATTCITNFIGTFNFAKDTVRNSGVTCISYLLSGLKSLMSEFYTVGKNAIDGFLNGVSQKANSGAVYSAGKNIGDLVLKGAKESLDIHSPSREMAKVGQYAIDGFVGALRNNKSVINAVALEVFGGFVESAMSSVNMKNNFAGIISQYANSYSVELGLNISDTLVATEAIKKYNELLYESSSYYKEDQKQLKEYTKSLQSLLANKQKLEVQLTKSRRKDEDDKQKTINEYKEAIKKSKNEAQASYNEARKNYIDTVAEEKDKLRELQKAYITEQTNDEKKLAELKKKLSASQIKDSKTKSKKESDNTKKLKQEVLDMQKTISSGGSKATKKAGKEYKEFLDEIKKGNNDNINNAKEDLKSAKSILKNGSMEIEELTKNMNKVKKASAESADTKEIINSIKEVDKEIETTKKNIDKQGDEIAKHTKEVLAEVRKSIKDSLTEFLSYANVSSSMMSLLDDVAETTKSTVQTLRETIKESLKDYTNIFDITLSLGTSFLEKLNNSAEDLEENINSAKESVTNANKEVEESNKEVEEATKALTEAQKALTEAQQKSDAVNGRSQKYLDAITTAQENLTEAENKLASAKEQVTSATKAQTEAQENLNKVQGDTAVKDLLENMKSNVNGVKEWRESLAKLEKRGLPKSLYNYLEELGISGKDQVDTFVKMTDAELKKACSLWGQYNDLSNKSLIDGLNDKTKTMTDWSNLIKKFSKLDIDDKVKSALLTEFQEKGVESASYIKQILMMDETELKDFITSYNKLLETPEEVAKIVSNTISKLNEQVVKENTDTVDELIKKMNANYKAQLEYESNIKKLKKRMSDDDAYEYAISNLSSEEIASLVNSTDEQITKFTSIYSKAAKKSADDWLASYKEQITDAKAWKDNMDALTKLNIPAKIKETLYNDFMNQGVSSNEMLERIIGFTPAQLKEFVSLYQTSDKLDDSIANKIVAGAAKVDVDTQKALNEAVEKAVDEAIEAGKEEAIKGSKARSKLVFQDIMSGISVHGEEAIANVTGVGCKALLGLSNKLSKENGAKISSNITSGLVQGLNKDSNKVITASSDLAETLLTSIRQKLQIHSPSKELEKIGKYSDEGLANGLINNSSIVEDASSEVVNNMSSIINSIARWIDSDIDVAPTIKPILDMSDLESKVSYMNSMFDSQSISINAETAAGISSRMNSAANIQNGSNTTNNSYDQSTKTVNNTFNISGDNPREIANEVSRILQQQVNRRSTAWA